MSAPFRPGVAEPVALIWTLIETGRALGDDEQAVADTLVAWLSPAERVALAAGALLALSPATARAVCETFLAEHRAGEPVPAFLEDVRAEARLWASWASPAELRAYLAACWHRLPQRDRSAFLKAARKVPA
jgi:hypothetical protein